jgi:DNA repair exonuclease SbcCD nuclease subunit
MNRVAVTADVHLRSQEERPERFNALRDVLEKTKAQGIDSLIIAGDLFDKDFQNYAEFESLCRGCPDVHLHIIPGNHDPGLEKRHVVADNATVYDEPTSVQLGAGRFLFLPYADGKTMGEVLADLAWDPGTEPWVLVGHGDYLGGTRRPNPLEPGVYMPLMRADLQRFRPRLVFLGHIHDPPEHPTVHYPGSPCGLDISETGRRRFLVLDTETWAVSEQPVDTDVLFFRERFVLVPHEEEVAHLRDAVQERVRSWDLLPGEGAKARIRAEVVGFVRDRNAVAAVLQEELSAFAFYKDEGPYLQGLSVSQDTQLGSIADKVQKTIKELDFEWEADEPTPDDVLQAALRVIYAER